MKRIALLFSVLTLAAVAHAQAPNRTVPTVSVADKVSGSVQVPRWHWRFIVPRHDREWHRVTIRLPKEKDPALAVAWMQDADHPVGSPQWTEYDPRNLAFQRGRFVFDARPGDHVSYVVGWRKWN